MAEHLIGLTLGTENDWPAAFEALVGRLDLDLAIGGERHTFRIRRMTFEPFSLRSPPACRLIIDRLAWWYTMPREWLKKVAMMDEVYLLNDPFTFQSMEKHTAYCAMMRLGLNIPETWMLPMKIGPDNERYPATAERYNRLFDIEKIAERIGYPLYMKPFDGGGWRGVSRIENAQQLHTAYDQSGQALMHLQASIEDYEWFLRSLSIGPQTRIMHYRPERPMHDRYDPELPILAPPVHEEVFAISHLINAFFRWEFNSCEVICKDGVGYPIDFANACPDVSLVSLHRHFPWAMTALVRWSIFCAATGRAMAMDMNKREYFAIGDRTDLSDVQKRQAWSRLAGTYFDTERFDAFCAEHLSHLDEVAAEYFGSREFDDLLVQTVHEHFPDHEQDGFVEHFRQAIRSNEATRG